jgi:hypothetical protein
MYKRSRVVCQIRLVYTGIEKLEQLKEHTDREVESNSILEQTRRLNVPTTRRKQQPTA